MSHAYNLTYNKELISRKGAVAAIGVVFFVLATALGAYVRIPVPGSPVPITLQTFFVLLAGAALGKRLGTISQVAYIALASSLGLVSVLGPTGGYLIGFMIAAYAVGLVAGSGHCNLARAAAAFSLGSVIIYGAGAAWLVLAYKMTFANAFSLGVLPFIPGDLAKVMLAALIYSGISNRTHKVFPV